MKYGVSTSPAGYVSSLRKELDAMARHAGGWPENAMVYKVECVNEDRVLMTGGIPSGVRPDGKPKFERRGKVYLAIVTIAEYRAGLGVRHP